MKSLSCAGGYSFGEVSKGWGWSQFSRIMLKELAIDKNFQLWDSFILIPSVPDDFICIVWVFGSDGE